MINQKHPELNRIEFSMTGTTTENSVTTIKLDGEVIAEWGPNGSKVNGAKIKILPFPMPFPATKASLKKNTAALGALLKKEVAQGWEMVYASEDPRINGVVFAYMWREYTVQVRVVCSAYKQILAKDLKAAKRQLRKDVRDGNYKDALGLEMWEDVQEINVAEDFINGSPKGDMESIDVSEIDKDC